MKRFFAPSGSREKVVFTPKVMDDGSIDLVPSGKENIYAYIQSFKDSVDIHVILKKAVSGDLTGLQKVQGFYADATRFPQDRRAMLQSVIDAQVNFEKLPTEIKEKFDNDFNKFFVTMDSKEWFEKMQMNNKKAEVKEVVEQEQ